MWWWKYREHTAHGVKKKWHTTILCAWRKRDAEEELDERGILSAWFEPWRGVDIVRLKKPPHDDLVERINRAKNELAAFRAQYRKYYNIEAVAKRCIVHNPRKVDK